MAHFTPSPELWPRRWMDPAPSLIPAEKLSILLFPFTPPLSGGGGLNHLKHAVVKTGSMDL